MQSLDLRRTFKHNVVFLDSQAEHQAFAVGVCSVYSEVICLISLCVGSVVVFVVVTETPLFLLCVCGAILGDTMLLGPSCSGLVVGLALVRRPGGRVAGFLTPWVLYTVDLPVL